MISQKEFELLYQLHRKESLRMDKESQGIFSQLNEKGLLDSEEITPFGTAVLESFHVDNAIILAAGYSSRFVPLSYDHPKALLNVQGEILIERLIKQLQDSGISEIVIVVGYKKELFSYLEEKYGVILVENKEYKTRNNHSSIYAAREFLGNSYICTSDNYFTKNVFHPYVYRPFYAAKYTENGTGEYCITSDNTGKIVHVEVGGSNSWYMFGHVYFDHNFSNKYLEFLQQEYNDTIKDFYWEDIYIEHIKELDLYMLKYDENDILEFDSLKDLRTFDSRYVNHTGSPIMEQIADKLGCKEGEIQEIKPLPTPEGTPHFSFSVHGISYQYIQNKIESLHNS